jgi:hypothetical protein
MAELVCAECGEANDFGAEFCVSCHAFLAWDEPERARVQSQAVGGRSGSRDELVVETQVMPRVQVAPGSGTRPRYGAPTSALSESKPGEHDPSAGLLRVRSEQHQVLVPPTGEPVAVDVQVTNTSTIVDGYTLEAVGAPGWLVVEVGRL